MRDYQPSQPYTDCDYEDDEGTVLTVRPPDSEGCWSLSITRDGQEVDSQFCSLAEVLEMEVTTWSDSDAAAAAEHAIDLLAEDFDVTVDRVVLADAAGTVDDAYDVSEVS